MFENLKKLGKKIAPIVITAFVTYFYTERKYMKTMLEIEGDLKAFNAILEASDELDQERRRRRRRGGYVDYSRVGERNRG